MENNPNQKPYIIGISGGSGTGKTSFVNALIKRVDADRMTVLTMDNYYFNRELQQIDEKGIRNFDLPGSIDIEAFKSDLNLLLNGQEVRRQEYTYNNEKAEAKVIVTKPAPVIVIEGLFIYHDQTLFDAQSLRIIVHAKDVVKVIRRIHRDQVERNYPIEDVLYRYEHHVLPAYEKFIGPFVDEVDLIINNNSNFDTGLDVLANHIQHISNQ